MKYDDLVDGWWIVESLGRDEHYSWTVQVRQISTGEERDIMYHRGPFPTRKDAEDFQWHDNLATYWEHGMTVYAHHCPGCGRYAKVLAFDDTAWWAWRVTECKWCGVIDSRTPTIRTFVTDAPSRENTPRRGT